MGISFGWVSARHNKSALAAFSVAPPDLSPFTSSPCNSSCSCFRGFGISRAIEFAFSGLWNRKFHRRHVSSLKPLLLAALRATLSFWPQAAVSDREELLPGLRRRAWSCVDKNFSGLIGFRTLDNFLRAKQLSHGHEDGMLTHRRSCQRRE